MKKVDADVLSGYLHVTEAFLSRELLDVDDDAYFEFDNAIVLEQIGLIHKILKFIDKMPDVS